MVARIIMNLNQQFRYKTLPGCNRNNPRCKTTI